MFCLLGPDMSKMARMLAEGLLLGEEKTPITYEQAYQLDVGFARVLTEAVSEVNRKSEGNRDSPGVRELHLSFV